jgi:hypothetical protein
MNNVDELLAAARRDLSFTSLSGARARGADEYLKALAHVIEVTDLQGWELRDMAGAYLMETTSGGSENEAKDYAYGTAIAYRLVRELQEVEQ